MGCAMPGPSWSPFPPDSQQMLMETVQLLYPKTLAGMKGTFSKDELQALLLICNSAPLDPRFAGQALKYACSGAVREHKLDDFEFSGSSFVAKVRRLGPFELFTLEIWGKAYWRLGMDTQPERAASHIRLLR